MKNPDEMRLGLRGSSAMDEPTVGGYGHPLEKVLSNRRERQIGDRVAEMQIKYGAGAAMKFQADCAIMEQFHRMPGIESSFTGLETLTGDDKRLRAEDWLGDRDAAPQLMADFHATMEHKLKM